MRFPYLAFLLFLTISSWSSSESQSIPRSLQGNWRVTSVLPTQTGCWSGDKAARLLNTTISYSGGQIHWSGAAYPITETLTRSLTADSFRDEYSKSLEAGRTLELASLGIRAPRVTELDLQHDDADITDVTTEVPGDTVLLVSPTRIVVSVCGTYFEATRGNSAPAANDQRAIQRTAQPAVRQQPAHKSGL